ncbi:MAG: hypothetical protein GWN62_31430, partial [Aliifodinibius sp.]|nr:VCBS repeat-containing protein [Nitrosopumilaceae archaeon]NIV15611.1 hypothetical protein [Fodinibius sp.]NIX62683.1 hypothetical protein [Nitrosopumilaceae archaeon]
SGDPYISISDDQTVFGDMDYFQKKIQTTNFVVSVNGNPDPGYIADITLRLEFSNPAGTYDLSIPILIEDSDHQTFPDVTHNAYSPRVWDFNNDKKEEIIITDHAGVFLKRLMIFQHNFNPNPIVYDLPGTSENTPTKLVAIGNIDTDDLDEIVVLQLPDLMQIINYSEGQFNLKHSSINTGLQLTDNTTPVLADVDNDNRMEIIVAGQNNLSLFEYDPNNQQIVQSWLNPLSDPRTPTVADLDQNGKPEIVVSHDNNLSILDPFSSGNQVATYLDGLGISTPTVADANNDGILEIICVITFASGSAETNKIKLFQFDGNNLDLLDYTSFSMFGTAADYEKPVVVNNIDEDPELELIFTHPEDGVLLFKNGLLNFIDLTEIYRDLQGVPSIISLENFNTPLILLSSYSPSKQYLFAWDNKGAYPFMSGNNNILYSYTN